MECNAADIGRSLIDLIFPPRCTACAKILEERRILDFTQQDIRRARDFQTEKHLD